MSKREGRCQVRDEFQDFVLALVHLSHAPV